MSGITSENKYEQYSLTNKIPVDKIAFGKITHYVMYIYIYSLLIWQFQGYQII